jgi:aspartyl/asparaginyl beta-hydroxylase (cupin superfamily)
MSSSFEAPAVDPHRANADGMAALRAGDPAKAARHFAAAAAADPKAVALWRNLANARRLLGDDAGERAALESALDADRTDFMAWLRKAQLHSRLNEEPDALIAWSGVLQLADRISPMPPEIAAQLDDGRATLEVLQRRISQQVDTLLAEPLQALTGTDARRAQAFVDRAMGRRQIYANKCAGLHYPFLPADEFFDDHHFPWFASLSAQAPAIRAELEALLAGGEAPLKPYVRMDAGTPINKWSALDHNLDWGAAFLWEYGAPNLEVLDRCPMTAAALSALPGAVIPGRAPSAFFSLLKPHTRIPAHTGVTNTRAIIHLPLIVPPACGFRVGGETRAWVEGVPFAFDDTIEHEAWNDSDQLRAVLIFDVWNPHLSVAEQQLIAAYYAAADKAA